MRSGLPLFFGLRKLAFFAALWLWRVGVGAFELVAGRAWLVRLVFWRACVCVRARPVALSSLTDASKSRPNLLKTLNFFLEDSKEGNKKGNNSFHYPLPTAPGRWVRVVVGVFERAGRLVRRVAGVFWVRSVPCW